MLSSATPARFNIPFAANAGGSYIRPIPQASQIGVQNGAASLTDGFPPDTFTPVSAGGVPPFGQDMNGILNQISLWSQWQAAGAPIFYDLTFATDTGGYPKGAVLASSTTNGTLWLNTADNNTTNPDGVGTANWVLLLSAGSYVNSATAGSVNWPGTPFIIKWKLVTGVIPTDTSDTPTGSFWSGPTSFSWNAAFPNACFFAFGAPQLVTNGNFAPSLVEVAGTSGGNLFTTSAQDSVAVPVMCIGFGW